MRYLALESSCDETAIAVWDSKQRKIVYEQIFSQIDHHRAYGGVVPGIAIREHLNSFPILLENLKENCRLSTLDVLCVTHGPGLIGCLGIGVAYAQSLQLLLKIPLYGINHLQGHAFSPFIESFAKNPRFDWEMICPHLGLLVSGGNTLLFEIQIIEKTFKFHIWAKTVDDAAGEALDKGARLLGFPYPGGVFIEKCARTGDANFVYFPRAFPQKSDLKFSFSGLKTSLRYFLEKFSSEEIEHKRSSICASYQAAIMDACVLKLQQVLEKKQFKSLGISGGVSQNQVLREKLQQVSNKSGLPLFMPPKCYCGDNAAMVAFAGMWIKMPVKLNPNYTLDASSK